MKTNQLLLILTAGLLSVGMLPLTAQIYVPKQHKMTVAGTSTLHDWESIVEQADYNAECSVQGKTLENITRATVRIPVKSIKSSKGRMMDSKTWDAFKYEKNSHIVFNLCSASVNGSTVLLKGTLSMAGTTKPVEVKASYLVNAAGDLQIKGTHKISMPDFGMTPPTAMMGTITVGDDVTVTFDMLLTKSQTNL